MKKFLTTLHRWLGFPLGLLFVVTFGSGALTAVAELLQRLDPVSEDRYSYHATSLEEDAQALAVITEGKQGIRQVIMPTPATPYYRVLARGESWTYPIDRLDRETYSETADHGFFPTMLQLHRHYLLGREGLWGIGGQYYSAWAGLLALLLSLLGLWLWWPLRRTFALRDVLPRGRKRRYFYYSHMTGGVVVVAVIMLLSLTGASITYRAFTQQLLGVERDKAPAATPLPLGRNWLDWLQAAHINMPEGARLEQIRFPRQASAGEEEPEPGSTPTTSRNKRQEQVDGQLQSRGNSRNGSARPLLEFRFHAPGDWLGLAGSRVRIDQGNSTLVEATRFDSLPLGDKVASVLVPLHTGRHLPAAYPLLLLLLSILGTLMVAAGLVSFVLKKRRRFKSNRLFTTEPVADA